MSVRQAPRPLEGRGLLLEQLATLWTSGWGSTLALWRPVGEPSSPTQEARFQLQLCPHTWKYQPSPPLASSLHVANTALGSEANTCVRRRRPHSHAHPQPTLTLTLTHRLSDLHTQRRDAANGPSRHQTQGLEGKVEQSVGCGGPREQRTPTSAEGARLGEAGLGQTRCPRPLM